MITPTKGPFYFIMTPNFFKTDHSFAKTIKSGTHYRLNVYKGIHLVEEMKSSFKAKLVGGKIVFDWVELCFLLQAYSPSRNIEFTVKVLETRPNEVETEIAHHRIKSGDFIKMYLNNGSDEHHEEVPLLDGLSLAFDLYVNTSKSDLEARVGQKMERYVDEGKWPCLNRNAYSNPGKKEGSEIKSEAKSDRSRGSSNSSTMKNKLVRRRGHDGQLQNSVRSRDESEEGGSEISESSHTISKRSYRETDLDINSVHEEVKCPQPESPKFIPSKPVNFVNVSRKESIVSEQKPSHKRKKSEDEPSLEHKKSEGNLHNLQQKKTERTRKSSGEHIKTEEEEQTVFAYASMESFGANGVPAIGPFQKSKRAEINEGEKTKRNHPSTLKLSKKNGEKKRESIEIEPISDNNSKSDNDSLPVMVSTASPRVLGRRAIGRSISIEEPPIESKEVESTDLVASKEYERIKEIAFYIALFLISGLLLWNAVTPSRKC